jgi:putative membrane protein
MMWNYGDWGQFGMGFGFHWVLAIAFWALVIWGVVSLHRLAARSVAARGVAGGGDSALAILKARYARGEITTREFRAMRKEMDE